MDCLHNVSIVYCICCGESGAPEFHFIVGHANVFCRGSVNHFFFCIRSSRCPKLWSKNLAFNCLDSLVILISIGLF